MIFLGFYFMSGLLYTQNLKHKISKKLFKTLISPKPKKLKSPKYLGFVSFVFALSNLHNQRLVPSIR